MRVMVTLGMTQRCVIAVAVTVAPLTGCGIAGTPTATTGTVVAIVPTAVTRTATATATASQETTGILAMIRKVSGSYFLGRPDGEVQALTTQIRGIYRPQNGGGTKVQIKAAMLR